MYPNKDLLALDWHAQQKGSPMRGWGMGVVVPERMIYLKHAKAARLLSDMAIKYGLIQHYLPTGSTVLDVGCGSGYGVSMMDSFGYKAKGIDLNERTLKMARFRQGLEFLHGKVEDLTETFDAVTSIDMIEHVHQPEQAPLVKAMVARLNPNGVFLIDTPFRTESASVSKHHVWELGFEEFGWLVEQAGPWKTIDKYYTVRFYDTYTVCIKANAKPPENPDRDNIIVDNQIIIATR